MVQPADRYIGMRTSTYFVERGTPLKVDVIVTDLDGKADAGRAFTVRAARLEWKFRNGSWEQQEADVQDCNMQSAADPVTCTFDTPNGGTYQITATVQDDKGR